jgi:hypothetical protein
VTNRDLRRFDSDQAHAIQITKFTIGPVFAMRQCNAMRRRNSGKSTTYRLVIRRAAPLPHNATPMCAWFGCYGRFQTMIALLTTSAAALRTSRREQE